MKVAATCMRFFLYVSICFRLPWLKYQKYHWRKKENIKFGALSDEPPKGSLYKQTVRINGGPVTGTLHIAFRSVALRRGEMCVSGRIPLQTIRNNVGPVTRTLHIACRSVALRSGEMCVLEGSLYKQLQ